MSVERFKATVNANATFLAKSMPMMYNLCIISVQLFMELEN
jgi:hypothetical protein